MPVLNQLPTQIGDVRLGATARGVKKSAHGVKRGVKGIGHEFKDDESKTNEAQK